MAIIFLGLLLLVFALWMLDDVSGKDLKEIKPMSLSRLKIEYMSEKNRGYSKRLTIIENEVNSRQPGLIKAWNEEWRKEQEKIEQKHLERMKTDPAYRARQLSYQAQLAAAKSYSQGTKSKDASVVGRAVAGGIVAGPAGAVVGALSAVDKNNKNRSENNSNK